jgi:hypothetical protein
MAEIAPAGGGPNRLFIVIALGLVGLLLLGLIAVGGVFLIPRILGTSAPPTLRVAVTTPTRNVGAAAVTAAPNTDTPIPTSTSVINTPVLVIGSPAAPSEGTITATTTITGTPGAGGTLPKSGLGEDLLLLAGGIILVLIIVAARRALAPGVA